MFASSSEQGRGARGERGRGKGMKRWAWIRRRPRRTACVSLCPADALPWRKLSPGGAGPGGSGCAALRMHLQVAEIYNNKAYDLLRQGKVRAKAVVLKERQGRDDLDGLSDHVPKDLEEAMGLVRQARAEACTSATALNPRSSRGHTFWMMELREASDEDGRGEGGGDGRARKGRSERAPPPKTRRLWIVDMAGSERIGRSRANGQEASHINQDHSALFKCLQQAEGGTQRVSYRDRTLTRLLKGMFVRNAGHGGAAPRGAPPPLLPPAFVMLVNVNPAASEYSETQKVLQNSMISIKARPNEKQAAPAPQGVAYGANGHLAKRPRAAHGPGGKAALGAYGLPPAGKRVRDASEVIAARPSPGGLLRVAEDRIAGLEDLLREADMRVEAADAEARAEVQAELFPVIDELEVRGAAQVAADGSPVGIRSLGTWRFCRRPPVSFSFSAL